MSDTRNPTKDAGNGPQKRMRPWEIAVKCFVTDAGQIVDIEHASDSEFQQFVKRVGIPVDENGIAEWSFDDRCGVINFALGRGMALPFVGQNNSENTAHSELFTELFVGTKPAPEGA